MRKVNCLRCGVEMEFVKRESIQLGEHTFFGGDFGNLLAGSLDADIYACPQCEKYEFFKPDKEQMKQDEIITRCPECGKSYSAYFAACPRCKAKKP